jgi:hypothetical protein
MIKDLISTWIKNSGWKFEYRWMKPVEKRTKVRGTKWSVSILFCLAIKPHLMYLSTWLLDYFRVLTSPYRSMDRNVNNDFISGYSQKLFLNFKDYKIV